MAVIASLFVNQKGNTTALKQPKEIGYYSRNQDGEVLQQDDSKLKYYYLPNNDIESKLDLTSGFKKFKNCQLNGIKSPEFRDLATLSPLLESIIQYESQKGKPVKTDIIASSETIVKLICSSFENAKINPIDMRMISYNGQLYIKDMTKRKLDKQDREVDIRKYVPFKFETMTTLSEPLPFISRDILEKRNRKISNNGEKFCSVVRSGISDAKILMNSDISCIFDFRQDGKDNLKHYAQLSCSSVISNLNDSHKFESLIFKQWLQCFLVGIPRIIHGFYDDNCNLKTVEEYMADEIPILLREHNPDLAARCTNAIKWYGFFTEWLLKIIPRNTQDLSIRPFRLIVEDNHLKIIEIESDDKEYDSIVEGEEILSSKYKEWRQNFNK